MSIHYYYDEPQPAPAPTSQHLYDIGTSIKFLKQRSGLLISYVDTPGQPVQLQFT